MAGFFYPKTDGSEGCDNFNRVMATRIRRALSLTLESLSQNDRELSCNEAAAVNEKIKNTLYPGGKMDVSTESEVDEENADDDDGAHILEVSSRWNGKKMETIYTVDFGRGDVREFTRYGLKQSFGDEWKNMVHRYKIAAERSMPTRMELKGASHGRRVNLIGATAHGRGNLLPEGADVADIGRADDVAELVEADGLNDMAGGAGSDGTSGDKFYRKGDRLNQGSTMVDSTDGRKHSVGRQAVLHRREGHGEGGLIYGAKHPGVNPKLRISDPVPRAHVARRDLQLERLPSSGPIRKRQRMSLNTPRTGPANLLDRTPLTNDGERGFLGTRTDTAGFAMEFMSRVLQNEEILKTELEDLIAQNKYLRGLLEDEELALNIADDELADVKRDRQERLQLEELLRSREDELRSVKLSLRKIQSKNENTIKDLTIEKEEWKAFASQVQDQLDRQLEQQSAAERMLEEKASLASRIEIDRVKKDLSLERDKWGKDAALKLNEIEMLRTSKAELTNQLKKSQTEIKTLEADLAVARSETQTLRTEHTMLSRRMEEDVTKMRAHAKEQAERAARAILNADEQLSQAMAMHDAWSKIPDGLLTLKHLLEFEDITGERVKTMDTEAKETFMRLRPSMWKHCHLASIRHDNGSNSFVFNVESKQPSAKPGASGSSSKFEVKAEELRKREYCQRAMCDLLIGKIKPKGRAAKPVEAKSVETKSVEAKSVETKSVEAKSVEKSQ